jgi:hypothetical protein
VLINHTLNDKAHRFHDCHFVGRIDLSEPSAPVFYYAGSYVVARFQGASLFYRYGFEVNGHPNKPQSARMAQELYEFISSQGLVT